MNHLKQFKGQLIFTFLLFIILIAMPFQDYLERNFHQGAMEYSDDAAGLVIHEDGFLTVPEHTGSVVLHTEDCYLPEGSYTATFNVTSAEPGSTVELYDPLSVNPDNTAGKVLASEEIPAGGESIRLEFTIDEYVKCIQFRVISNTPLEFRNIYLLSQMGLFCDPYIYAGLLLLGSALLFVYRFKKRVRPEVLILLAFAAVWASMPLCFPYLLDGHDLYFHYSRLFCLSEDLAGGAFPVRIHTQMWHGFTYLSPVFYPEFFLYPFALLGRMGMSPMGCYKLLLLAINFATAGISYYSFSRLCRSRRVGLIAAFLYTLSMYRLINLYTRAAIGEALAMVFLPLLALGMYQLFLGDSRRWLTSVLAFTALLQSHLVSTELAVGFSLLFGLIHLSRLKEKKRLLHLILAAASTVLLNLWFLLPLLDHMQYPVWVLSDKRDLAYSSLYALQIFDVTAGNTASDLLGPGSVAGEMPYTVGIVLLIGALLFLFTYVRKSRKGFLFRLGGFCLVLASLCLYASSAFFPWKALQRIPLLNLLGNMQFTFRFLPFATLFLCLASAVGICCFFKSRESGQLLFILSVVLTICTAGQYFHSFANEADLLTQNHQMDYACRTDDIYLIGGEEVSEEALMEREIRFLPSEGVTLRDCARDGSSASFTYEISGSSGASYVDVPLNYYPYYHAYNSSGELLVTESGDMARLRVLLPENSGDTVTIRFELPGLYRAGDIISLLTLLLLAAGILAGKKRFAKGRD